jgi:phosphoglycolate phosphatase-like HAD superfamily hydrolase
MYLDALHTRIANRLTDLRSGSVDPDVHMVPGSRALLEDLKARGMTLYLASGTDQVYVHEEARLLNIFKYFDGGVYGARDDYKSFSKKILVHQIISRSDFRGEEFLGFGDGYVEIENVKEVGGVTVGVASDEPACLEVDQWKRKRLIGVGADYIIPNYLHRDALFARLF